jgi:hypothetical protein
MIYLPSEIRGVAPRCALLSPPLWAGLSHMNMRGAFLSLPLVGRVGERERAGVGVFKKSQSSGTFSATSTPPPDRRFATATLPTLSRGRDKKEAPPSNAIALPLWGRGGEGGIANSAICGSPPSLISRASFARLGPHKGEGNDGANVAYSASRRRRKHT